MLKERTRNERYGIWRGKKVAKSRMGVFTAYDMIGGLMEVDDDTSGKIAD